MKRFDTKEAALREVYGYDAFRGVQADAIEHACAGRDVLVVMATGGGKSLCYQIPPLVQGRAAVVVSPLVSLMQDQVLALEARGLTACFLGSAQADAGVWSRLETYQFVYATPEMASTERFREAMRLTIRPCLLAIDEAHCVSEWGHDFRPEYRALHALREPPAADAEGALFASAAAPPPPLMAVTATATPRTRDDIRANLRFGAGAATLATGVDRANLLYTTVSRRDRGLLVDELRAARPGAAIVYVSTTKEAGELATWLSAQLEGAAVAAYHGKMDAAARQRVHHAFLRDETPVVVATLAFGMGIDKPDVRLVVHWGAPKTVESYYQQAGRAGRDGDPARCVLFTERADWPKLERLLTHDVEPAAAARALAGLRAMRAFCEDRGRCRRASLAAHFGDAAAARAIACGACDACTGVEAYEDDGGGGGAEAAREDVAAEAFSLLRCVRALEGFYGLSTVVDVCRGAPPAKHAARLGHLSDLADARWSAERLRAVADTCRARGLLEDTVRTGASFVFAAPTLTEAGAAWLAQAEAAGGGGGSPPALHMAALRSTARKRGRDGGGASSSSSSASQSHPLPSGGEAMLHRLRQVRSRLASGSGVAPYMVCSDRTLREMVRLAPRTRADLLRVPGIGAHKAQQYGGAFLETLGAA